MATIEIPIPTIAATTGSVRLRVELDGEEYSIRLQWNVRAGTWTIDVADANDSMIVAGIVLVPNWSLLGLVTDERKPPGTLSIWQPDGSEGPPTLEGLGTLSKLLYYEAA